MFRYAGQITPIPIAFIVLAALEIPALAVLLPWPAIRYPLLVLGVWGLLWLLGFLAALRVNPHVVSDLALQIRSGFQFDTRVTWDRIADLRLRRSSSGQKFQVDESDRGAIVSAQRTTNVEVTFREPVEVSFIEGRRTKVSAVRFYADSPTELVAAARAQLNA